MPRTARAFVLGVDVLFVLALVLALARTSIHVHDLTTFGVLVGCGVLSIEGSLRLVWRQPQAGTLTNDMLGVWTLPVALVLPPMYALLVVLPLEGYFYFRVMRRVPVKWMFNTASAGLAGFVAATMHVLFLGHEPTGVRALVGTGTALALTVACALVRQAINSVFIAEVIALTKPGARLSDVFADREAWGGVAAESCTGMLVAVACTAAPYAVLLAIPPVLVLQRTLLVAEFREAARTDAKTGLANSAYWREVAEREITRARGGGEPLAVLLVDIDHFKLVNDRYGHLTGDDVLRGVADGLTQGLRPRDFVGRFGGEEFVVLLAGSDLQQAKHTAERIRARVAEVAVQASSRGEEVRVTVSVGVAAFRDSGHSVHELLDAADTALYAAKHAGRNCVRVAEGTRQQVLDLTTDQRVIDLRAQADTVT